MKTAKFDIKDLLPIGMTLVVLGIGLAYGLNVMGDVRADEVTGVAGCNATATTSCGASYNASSDAITAVAKIPEKLGLIVTVIIAAVIIGILVRYLFVRFA